MDRLLELIEDLMKQDPLQKLILGNISKGWKPVRNPKSKYFITEAQYAEENYPDFATGPSYLVSKAAVEPLVETALGELYIHLEDVFLTGVVAEKLGVERRNNDQFKNNAVRVPARFMGCTLLHTITIHKVTFSQFAQRSKECAFFHHYQGSIDFNTVNIHRTVGMYFLVSTGNRGDIE